MNNLKIFASMEEFEAAKPSMDTPFVVLEKGTPKVIYSNLVEISEDELDTGEYIDLGLPSGLKWASCNIGANKPCESGLLFQFGRVDGYAYKDNNHQFSSGTSTPTTTSGKTYKAGSVLDPADDAAYQATNGKAHMPTAADIDELLKGTTNEWCQCNVLDDTHTSHNVYGRLFTSKTNGKKIFIPAAGCFNGSFRDAGLGTGSNGYLWSSSVYSTSASLGDYLRFNSGSGNCYRSYAYRYCGHSVRGVCK